MQITSSIDSVYSHLISASIQNFPTDFDKGAQC